MAKYDYEIRGWYVEWKIGEKIGKQDGFKTEESAVEFARNMLEKADSVAVVEKRHVIGWWE